MKRSEKESMNVNLSFWIRRKTADRAEELQRSMGSDVLVVTLGAFWGSVLTLRNPSGWPEMMPGASPNALNAQPRHMQSIY